MFTARLDGLDGLTQDLKRYGGQVRQGASSALTRGAVRMHKRVTERSPVDTGRYRASHRRRTPAKLQREVFTDVVYGPHLEYGTRRAQAQPHYGPAWEETRPGLLSDLRSVLDFAEGR